MQKRVSSTEPGPVTLDRFEELPEEDAYRIHADGPSECERRRRSTSRSKFFG